MWKIKRKKDAGMRQTWLPELGENATSMAGTQSLPISVATYLHFSWKHHYSGPKLGRKCVWGLALGSRAAVSDSTAKKVSSTRIHKPY